MISVTQYVQQSHTNWQNGIHLPFQYSETELLLQFEAEHSYQGWQIRPTIVQHITTLYISITVQGRIEGLICHP